MFALQLIYISVLFRPRAYEYAAFSAVSRVAVAGSSGAVSEEPAHKILISESLKVLANFQKPTAAFVQMSEEPFALFFRVLRLFVKREGWFRLPGERFIFLLKGTSTGAGLNQHKRRQRRESHVSILKRRFWRLLPMKTRFFQGFAGGEHIPLMLQVVIYCSVIY